MPDQINTHFQDIIVILDAAEKRHRATYESALDIPDFAEAQATSAEAQRSILQIREWRNKLNAISGEISASNILEASGETPPVDSISENPPQAVEQEIHPLQEDGEIPVNTVDTWYNSLQHDRATNPDDHTIVLNVKRQGLGEHIFTVGHTGTVLLSLPDGIRIAAYLKDDSVCFYAIIGETRYGVVPVSIDQLVWRGTQIGAARIMSVPVSEDLRRTEKTDFQAWIAAAIDGQACIDMDVVESNADAVPPSYAGTKPRALTLLGKTYAVHNWNEVYLKVCEIMLLYKPYIVASLHADEGFNTDRRTYFSYVESDIIHNRKRLPNGLWIETNLSADDCVGFSHRVMEKCGYAQALLSVEIEED